MKHPLDLIGRRLASVAARMLEEAERDGGCGGRSASRKRSFPLLRHVVSPKTRRHLRFAFVACTAAASLLLMVADVVSDDLVIKELNALRLGENAGRGILDAEAIFNATGRRTLLDAAAELAESSFGGDSTIFEVCAELESFALVGSGTGQCEKCSSKATSDWTYRRG